MKHLALSILTTIYSSVSSAGMFGPNNYDECILESMKGVTSDVAARAIARSCSEKFPAMQSTDTEVPAAVVSKLDGRGGIDSRLSVFDGTIYNGNSDWTITQITVEITHKPKGRSEGANRGKREYNVETNVKPLTMSEFYFSVENSRTGEIEWSIVKARGHRSR